MKVLAPVLVVLVLIASSSVPAAEIPTDSPPLQIVTCRKGVDMEGLIQENGLTPKFRYRALNGFAAPMPEAVIQQLKADPRVMFVEADAPVVLCDQIDTWTTSQVNGWGAVRMGCDRFPMSRCNGQPKQLDVDVAVLANPFNVSRLTTFDS